MSDEIIDFFYSYTLGRQLKDFTYTLCINQMAEAIETVKTHEAALIDWLDENT